MIGHDAIGSYWQEGAVDGQRNVRFDATLWSVDETGCTAHWTAGFTRVPGGEEVRLDGILRLCFARDSSGAILCTTLREWWHRA